MSFHIYLKVLFAIFFMGGFLGTCQAQPKNNIKPLTILLSIDGFKPEYLKRNISPNLNTLAKNGALASHLISTFPSVTFPNHYSMVTGLYPDQHGIVNNTMVDPLIPETFTLSARKAIANSEWWNEGVPIWVSLEEQGGIASTLFWPGTETKIRNRQPRDWLAYDHNMTSLQRTEKLLVWLNREESSRADFATLYFSEVDSAGHRYGPKSEEVNKSIKNVDYAIEKLLFGLDQIGILKNTTFIIVSDHGMVEVPLENKIQIDEILKAHPRAVIEWQGPLAGIRINQEILSNVLNTLKQEKNMDCWHKASIPAKYRFGSHRRIPDIVCLAKIGYTIADKNWHILGQHGHDPYEEEMFGIFIASGYRVLNKTIGGIENIEVYPLLLNLLNIKGEKNSAKDLLYGQIIKSN